MSIRAKIKARIVSHPARLWKRSATLRMIEFFLITTLFDLAQTMLPYMSSYLPRIPPEYLLGAASLFGSLAYIARFIFQPKLSGKPDANQ